MAFSVSLIKFVVAFSFLAPLHLIHCNRIVQALLENYDKDTRPYFETNMPVNVSVQMYINSMDSINEINMEYKVKMYLRMKWHDPRLAYGDKLGTDVVNVDSILFSRFWTPDPFFINEKAGSFHKLTKENQMIKILPDGSSTSSMRISVVLSCPMFLHDFPLDDQACPLELESFAYDSTQLNLLWLEDQPVQINEDIDHFDLVPEFDLVEYDYARGLYNYTLGSFPFLRVVFHFQRRFGYYFFAVYLPSFIVVLLSWVAFWIDPKAVPARICIGFLTVLTMITQSAGVRNSLPRVSYVKAVDVWMVTCLLLVSVALVEYAVAHSIIISYTGIETLHLRRKKTDEETPPVDDPKSASSPSSSALAATRGRRCDEISRFLFPIVFFIFNVIYWIYYLTMGQTGVIKSPLHK